MIYLIVAIAILIPFYLLYLLFKAASANSPSLEDSKSVIESSKEQAITDPKRISANSPVSECEDLVVEILPVEVHITTERALRVSELDNFCSQLFKVSNKYKYSENLNSQQMVFRIELLDDSFIHIKKEIAGFKQILDDMGYVLLKVDVTVPVSLEKESEIISLKHHVLSYQWTSQLEIKGVDFEKKILRVIDGEICNTNSLKAELKSRQLSVVNSCTIEEQKKQVGFLKRKLSLELNSRRLILKNEEYKFCVYNAKMNNS